MGKKEAVLTPLNVFLTCKNEYLRNHIDYNLLYYLNKKKTPHVCIKSLIRLQFIQTKKEKIKKCYK